jgi:D-serine deaminase-like pyridoxal phosphate-dependent protein
MTIDDLDTPAVLIDYDRLQANILRMQRYCDAHHLAFRPHVKTHKIAHIAQMQLAAGATGLCCQKLGEAEAMIDAGHTHILIPYNIVGSIKIRRLLSLSQRATVAVAADSAVVVEKIGAAARQAGLEVPVLIECDTGHKRAGVQSPAAALALAQLVVETPGVRFGGLLTYPTHPVTTREFMGAAVAMFAAQRLAIPCISGGGTPLGYEAHTVPQINEHRAGTYVYHDRSTVGFGVATWDECAMRILATVVSRPTPERAILDAGSKTLSSDTVFGHPEATGHGRITEYPEAVIRSLSEEHGIVDTTAYTRGFDVEERVTIIPNHACVVSNLHDRVYTVRGDTVLDCWPVTARGTVQ